MSDKTKTLDYFKDRDEIVRMSGFWGDKNGGNIQSDIGKHLRSLLGDLMDSGDLESGLPKTVEVYHYICHDIEKPGAYVKSGIVVTVDFGRWFRKALI